jgi:Uma2 family endonuclease
MTGMSEAERRMTAAAFLEWCTFQEDRYELVDGVPVAMAGAKQVHDRLTVNAIIALGRTLRDGPCRPNTADIAIRVPNGNLRRPDVLIDCGTFEPESLIATDPRVVIEVLSPSTRTFDAIGKLREYQRVPTLQHIILIDPDQPRVLHWQRQDWQRQADGSWTDQMIEGLDAVVALPDIAVVLPLAELYAGLTFSPRPRVVIDPGT